MMIAFVIMQIGNKDLDRIYDEAIAPAIRDCGLESRRIDKHNKGGLLKSEIVTLIRDADIIVADLTNERPNCYLEIGFAMGLDKFRNLILTVRGDHFLENPDHVKGGPKVHIDLAGYDVLPWSPERIEEFRGELFRRIRRRLTILEPSGATQAGVWDNDWIESQRAIAKKGLFNSGLSGFMELRFALEPPKIRVSQTQLNEACREAPIRTFGWPIGVYLGNRPEFRPKPRTDGIFAEVPSTVHKTYDYWAVRTDGDYYLLGSLHEDQYRPGHIFFNTRIVRVTEALLFCARLYSRLGVDRSAAVALAVRHGGLTGRILSSSNTMRDIWDQPKCLEDETEAMVTCKLFEIEDRLVGLVKAVLSPLFILFDFFEVNDSDYMDIVDKFVEGKVT